MNFLAHIYLSGDNPKIMVGNFIGDFVKGRNLMEQFAPEIVKGIELHRAIDEFTDHHPVVRESKIRLRPKYRHYSAVIVDVFYDHYLSKYWGNYHQEPLIDFSAHTYKMIQNFWDILPGNVKYMLPHMIKDNWLLNYGKIEGIQQALSGMSRRSRHESKMDESVTELKEYYDEFKAEFELFFPELSDHAKQFISSN
ncbi:MAG: DUF479 domain-containing protein [Marivirga sp.]|nr:DUF479 domain-containing protein [Marivirga sp.]